MMTESDRSRENIVAAPMAPARFREMIDIHGASIERWPEAERDAAATLLEHNAAAREALAETALLGRLLDAAEPPPPSTDLRAALARRFAERRPRRQWTRWLTTVAPVPSGWGVVRPAFAFAVFVMVIAAAVMIGERGPAVAPPAPTVVQYPPTVDLADGALLDVDDGPLELEIALIDRDPANAPAEDGLGGFPSSFDMTVASVPSIEDVPLL